MKNDVIGSLEGSQGKDKSISLWYRSGLDTSLRIYGNYNQAGYTITICYEHNYTFGKGLDGYNSNPAKFLNNATDQYARFTLGFRYNFGNTVSYNKQIRNFRFWT